MFFFPILNPIVLFCVAAAVLPAAYLLRYIYRLDTIEKEPPRLIWALILGGVGAALCSIVLGRIGNAILNSTLSPDNPYYVIVLAFLVVAAVEEGSKLFFLKRRSWNDVNFTHMFDAVVYSAAVSLGFAGFENIQYVFSYGLSVVIPRALLSIPGHLGFSVFMGVFYAKAKACENMGDDSGKTRNLFLGYLSAVMLHGFYDACAMSGTTLAQAMFYAFVVIMYITVYGMIKRSSQYDRPL